MRGIGVTLNPLGITVSPDFSDTIFCFEDVAPGEYAITLSLQCNPSGCWPDSTPVNVVDQDVFIRIRMTSAPTPTPTPVAGQFRICGCVDEYPSSSCGMRGIGITLHPLDITVTPDFFDTIFCFENVPPGEYSITLSPLQCNPSGCWPDSTPATVVNRDIFVRIMMITTPTPSPGFEPSYYQ
jgi:hypothetical protein